MHRWSMVLLCFTACCALQPSEAQGETVMKSCRGLFSGHVGLLGQEKEVTARDILSLNLSDDDLRDRFARISVLEFEIVPPSLFERVRKETRDHVKDPRWDELLQRIAPGEWQKVMLSLRSGQELHYYEYMEADIVAFPKWK